MEGALTCLYGDIPTKHLKIAAYLKNILFFLFDTQWLGQSDVEGVQTRILPWMLSTVECGPAERF
jgi:hypothetical protein